MAIVPGFPAHPLAPSDQGDLVIRLVAAALLALAVPTLGVAQTAEPNAQRRSRFERHPFHLSLTGGIEDTYFADADAAASELVNDFPLVSIGFQAGYTIHPKLLVGGEYTFAITEGYDTPSVTFTTNRVLGVLTFFPARHWFFVRAGAGLMHSSYDVVGEDYWGNYGDSFTSTGLATMLGIGSTFPLPGRFQFSIGADAIESFGGDAGAAFTFVLRAGIGLY